MPKSASALWASRTRTPSAKFDLGPGQVRLALPKLDEPRKIELRIEETDLVIDLEPGVKIQITSEGASVGKIAGSWDNAESGPRYVLHFTKRQGGSVTIQSVRAE